MEGVSKLLQCGLKVQLPPQPRASPWVNGYKQNNAPCKGNYKNKGLLKLPLQGALSVNALYPGRCPGLWKYWAFSPLCMSFAIPSYYK